MDVMPTFGYRDIYNSDPPSLVELLVDVPSSLLITALCKVNALLYLNRNSIKIQFECFNLFASRINPKEHPEIASKIGFLIEKYNDDMTIFHPWYTLTFVQYELLNYREVQNLDITPEQELNILKAYFSIIDICNDKHLKILRSLNKISNDPLFFQKTSWPILFEQHLFNNKEDASYLVIRSLAFFAYLNASKKYEPHLKLFLEKNNRDSSWDYVSFFLNLAHSSLQYNEHGVRTNFRITKPEKPDPLTEDIKLSISAIQNDPRKVKDFLGLKEKPLYDFEDSFVAIHWGFLFNKLYTGLLFDFYKTSDVDKIFKSMPDFLNDVAQNLSERILFKALISRIFESKYNILQFDDETIEAMPDCYIRIGKYIFIFEFKDALISADIIDSCDFDVISKDIDLKFVKNAKGKSKGISQLFEQIKCLNEDHYAFDNFENKNLKRRNLVIYPIIVYTNFIYSAPGVTDYLNKKFKSLVQGYSEKQNINFEAIKDLTMIDIEFLYRNFKIFQQDNKYFKELLDQYHDAVKSRVKKMHKEPSSKNVLTANESFEQIVKPYHGKSDDRKFNIISELFEELKIEIPEEIKAQIN